MKTFLIALMLVVACCVAAPTPCEAACGRGILRPFGGRGVPVLRRIRGRGVGQANYGGAYFGGSGGCAGGSCSR